MNTKRGFAAFTPEMRREIGRLGGKSVHARGTAHRFTSDEARAAGRKGGQVTHERGVAPRFTSETAREAGRKGGQAVSQDREHMARIGRNGASRRRGKAQQPSEAQAGGVAPEMISARAADRPGSEVA